MAEDYGIENSVNIRTIYDTAGPFTDGQDGILENSGAKIEFFLGTNGTSYLPFRNNQSYHYPPFWSSTTSVPNAFVGAIGTDEIGRFPMIGTVISDHASHEGNLHANWLAFHPSAEMDDPNVFLMRISAMRFNTIAGYTLYFGATSGASCSFRITTNTDETHLAQTSVNTASSTPSTGWTYVGTEDQYTNVHKYTKSAINIEGNDYIDIRIDGDGHFGGDASVLKVILHLKPLTQIIFSNNVLTIENSINASDTDEVQFVLPTGESMTNFSVTNFTGSGTITYTLATDGATDITGTFTEAGTNLLAGTPLFAIAADTTYTLALISSATINYTITGTKLSTMFSSEYSNLQLIDAGYYTQQQLIDGNFWIADVNANHFLPIYGENLMDISGGNLIVRDNFIMGSGNIDVSNVLFKRPCTFDAAISVNTKLIVTGDVSMGVGVLNVAGDIQINGNLSVETYKNNSISTSAVMSDGSITGSNITSIFNDASYDKLQINGDVSLNATIATPGYMTGTVYTPSVYQDSSTKVTYFGASTSLKLTNGIKFSDGTILNTTNVSSGSVASNNIVFKASRFNNMTVSGVFTSNQVVSSSDYRIKTNIQELDETHTIDKLRPVTYYQTKLKKNAIGFIAHELQEHYPELVEGEKDGDKMQSVNYTGILAILINEIKQLKQNIKDTRNTLSAQNSAS